MRRKTASKMHKRRRHTRHSRKVRRGGNTEMGNIPTPTPSPVPSPPSSPPRLIRQPAQLSTVPMKSNEKEDTNKSTVEHITDAATGALSGITSLFTGSDNKQGGRYRKRRSTHKRSGRKHKRSYRHKKSRGSSKRRRRH